MKRFIISIIVLFACVTRLLQAQNSTNLLNFDYNVTPSSEIFEMSRYGEVQPTLFTGAMSCSIPLYTYEDPDFTIPLFLEYYFGGYKPSMNSGIVGLGWHLNVGGFITREVRGIPDETYSVFTSNSDALGYYYTVRYAGYENLPLERQYTSYILGLSWLDGIANLFTSYPVYKDYANAAPGNTPNYDGRIPMSYDSAPDVFHFNFLGYTGDFMMDENGDFHIYNCDFPGESWDVSLFPVTSYANGQASEFLIRAGDGYIYRFGGDFSHIEYSLSREYSGETFFTNVPPIAWKLKSITAPNGNTVVFNYSLLPQQYLNYSIQFLSPSYTFSGVLSGIDPQHSINGVSSSDNRQEVVQNTFSSELTSIQINGVTYVTLDYEEKSIKEFSASAFNDQTKRKIYSPIYPYGPMSPSPERRLRSIVIKNLDGEKVDSIGFVHTFSNSSNGSAKMLLDSLQTRDGLYSFQYNLGSNAQFPHIDISSIDHWGYWRGEDYTDYPSSIDSSYIPVNSASQQEISLYNLSSWSRNSVFSSTMMGSMKKIVYPTGGETIIEYEKNDTRYLIERRYYEPNSNIQYLESYPLQVVQNVVDFQPGGVRVKKLLNTCEDYTDSKTYTYRQSLDGLLSSGILMQMPLYMVSIPFYLDTSPVEPLWPEENTIWSIIGAGVVTGKTNLSNLSLSRGPVVGYSTVQEHHSNGSYTEYKFYDYIDYHDEYSVDEIRNDVISGNNPGAMIKISAPISTDYSSMRGRLKSVSLYDNLQNEVSRKEFVWQAYTDLRIGFWYNALTHLAHGQQTCFSPRLVKETETYSDGGASFQKIINKSYSSHNQLLCESVTHSDHPDEQRTYYRWLNESDPDNPFIVSDIVKSVSRGGKEYLLDSEQYLYDSLSRGNHNPTEIRQYLKQSPYSDISNVSSVFSVGRFSYPRTYRFEYDSLNRIVGIQKPGGAYEAFSWDSSLRHIVSKVVNDNPNRWSYQWKDLVGLLQSTDPQGVSEAYCYDEKGRIKEIRDTHGYLKTAFAYNIHNDSVHSCPVWMSGLDVSQTNYISVKTNEVADGSSFHTDLSYYDGFGYPALDIQLCGMDSGDHILTPYSLDNMRRVEAYKYMPYLKHNSVGLPADRIQEQQDYYSSIYQDAFHPYMEYYYEARPDNRLAVIGRQGYIYELLQKQTSYTYATNDLQADMIFHLEYEENVISPFVVKQGYYSSGALKKETRTNEDGEVTILFKNSKDELICSRAMNGNAAQDTYFVYDLCGRKAVVVQPMGAAQMPDTIRVSSSFSEKYCFMYQYDECGNVTKKRIPGRCWEYYIYDERGRLVFSTDESLSMPGINGYRYHYYEYDSADRLIEEGYASMSADFSFLRDMVKVNGNYWGWFLVGNREPFRINQYYPESSGSGLYGLLYKEYLKEAPDISGNIVPDSCSLRRTYYYDDYARVSEKVEVDEENVSVTYQYGYDFQGNLNYLKETHRDSTNCIITESVTEYLYNGRGQIVRTTQSIDGIPLPTVLNRYNERGLLSKQRIGGDRAKEIDYNLQGWIEDIRYLNGLDTLFVEQYSYYNPTSLLASARFGGDISQVHYKFQYDSPQTAVFKYDSAGRHNEMASFSEENSSVPSSFQHLNFDKNGNVTSYYNYWQTGGHELYFEHEGNRAVVTRVFPNAVVPLYNEFDSRGNMTKDASRNLEVDYNYLNMPSALVKDSSITTRIHYYADGVKSFSESSNGLGVRYRGHYLYRKQPDGSWKPESTLTDFGRVVITQTGSGLAYGQYWYLTDYKGDVREIIRLDSPYYDLTRNNYLSYGTRLREYNPYDTVTEQFSSSGEKHRWRFSGQEEIPESDSGLIDFGLRYYSPYLMRWMTPDPLAEDYSSTSPYVYCADNPIRVLDARGDSLAVIQASDHEHIALLIQNEDGKWAYYSINGKDLYFGTTFFGGKTKDEKGALVFDSVQKFLDSTNNVSIGKRKERMNNFDVTGSLYLEAYVLDYETDDRSAVTQFNALSNEKYSLFSRNCATIVRDSIRASGIDISGKSILPSIVYQDLKRHFSGRTVYKNK